MGNAIVVGASSGIGRALAWVLARNGYGVGLTARRLGLLQELAAELPSPAWVRQMDVSDTESAMKGLSELIEEMGDVELFILNAGVGFSNWDLEWGPERDTIGVNVAGFAATANVAVQHLVKRGGGSLAGISSIAALRGDSESPAYGASKAFMSNYLGALRQKFARQDVSIVVTDVQPGLCRHRYAECRKSFLDGNAAKGGRADLRCDPQAEKAHLRHPKMAPDRVVDSRPAGLDRPQALRLHLRTQFKTGGVFMSHRFAPTAILAAGLFSIALAPASAQERGKEALMNPAEANETAPDTFQVLFDTTKGEFTIEVTRAWAPNGADRFYNLVRRGYYDEVRFFRVLSGFMAQFGISGDPQLNTIWREARIPDDPVEESNRRGYVSFATAGPNTRTTQMFINYGNNSGSLDSQGFSPFGRVTDGMDVVDDLYSGYGEGAPSGRGPNQQLLQTQGNPYLDRKLPRSGLHQPGDDRGMTPSR